MKTKSIFTFLLLFLFSTSLSVHAQSSSDVYFASDPAVSPDGETIVFSYETDLWKTSVDGGSATRLTAMDGNENSAAISPDGKWLAFSSSQYGNSDIYLMPLQGGEIKRLTYHQAADNVESWSWDSQTIYFRSGRENRISTYAVSIDGGTPNRLFGHYHNNVHNYVEHPASDEVFFNESWESFVFPQRKKYRGPFNPEIKSYNTATGEFKTYTNWEGKDFWPMVDKEGKLYFVSDEANGEYNLYTIQDGEKKQLTNFKTSVRNPSISADGSVIVFEKEYRLFTYNTATGRSKKVSTSVLKNNTLQKEQSFNISNEISAFDVAPDQKKVAMVSRGELFVSDIEGKFPRKLQTSADGRVLEVKWLEDNKTLIFNQTVKGYQNWFTISADGTGAAKQLTDDTQNNRMLNLNADRTKGVYLSGRDQLRIIDLETFKSETIVEDEFWGFQNDPPQFSPDGEHVLYSARRDFETDLFVYQIQTEETFNLTNTGISEQDAFWSPDGRYIYFASTRTNPSYPRGGGETDLYRMALNNYEDPYKSDEFDQMFEEKEEAEKEQESDDKETVSVSINKDGLMHRLEQIGSPFGYQGNPYVVQQKDKTHVFYMSNHDEGNTSLWFTTLEPFESADTKKVDGINGFVSSITSVDGKLYGLSRGSVYSIDASSAKATKVETDHTFNRNLKDEFNQMFEELWANVEENFYNETFHGINWKDIRDRYKTYLPHVNSRNDFRQMLNDMLGELNSSHMGFSTSGEEEQEYYSTVSMSPGLIFEKENPYTVSRIINDGPMDVSGKYVEAGDVLVAIDGKQLDQTQNREFYFSKPDMPEEVTFTFERNGNTHNVKVHPEYYFSSRTDLYDEWVEGNQTLVDQKTDKKVAYVHMKNMGGGELENFLIEMTSEAYNRDALILDLRYNTGGNVHDAVLQFLSQRPYLQWKYRNGDFADQPNFSPAGKPIVVLINEQSLSDAEVTTAGFKELGLGTVIGMPTYRWIIFTSGKGLVDGSFYRLPSWGVYNFDGENLEKIGVQPHIKVNNTFKDRLQGTDPQLNRAIQEIMDKLEKN